MLTFTDIAVFSLDLIYTESPDQTEAFLRDARSKIAKCEPRILFINCEKVDVIPSSLIAGFIALLQLCREHDIHFGLLHVNQRMQTILSIARLEELLPSYTSTAEGLRHLRNMATITNN